VNPRSNLNHKPAGDADTTAALVVLAAAAVLLLAAALTWAAGTGAALATGRGWPALPAGDAPGALLRLPHHLTDPAAAWPDPYRRHLPGPVPYYAAALTLLTAAGLPAAAAARRYRSRTPQRRAQPWARRAEVRPLRVHGTAEPGRLLLGQLGRTRLAAEPHRSLLVCAPTRAGKTTRIVIPNVQAWNGPVLVTSVKPDVLHATADARAARGPVLLFDPTGSTGIDSVKWSPLLGCTTYADAERVARWLTDAAAENRSSDNARFWEQLGAKLLAPLLYAAAGTGRHMIDVARWVDRRATAEPEAALLGLGDPDALDAWAASRAREERQRESVYATAETVLRAITSPSVRATTTIRPEDHADERVFDPATFLDRAATLHVVAPPHEQDRLRPLFEAIVQTVLREAVTRHLATGQPLNPPLLVVLDEAANIAPLRDLARHVSTCAALGVTFLTIWQDLAQLHHLYGAEARTIANNHTGRLFLGGNADLDTLTTLSQTIGDTTRTRASTTIAARHRSTTYAEHTERAAPADQLRQLPLGQALLLYGGLPPIRVRLPRP
jgi:type IV secretory pathway TraG/TraD family ATPase VirD4